MAGDSGCLQATPAPDAKSVFRRGQKRTAAGVAVAEDDAGDLVLRYSQLLQTLASPRSGRGMSAGVWREEERAVEIILRRGNMFDKMGYQRMKKLWLHIEEAVWLVDRGSMVLIVDHHGQHSMLSLQQCYDVMWSAGVSTAAFQVYSHLQREGFIVRRHPVMWTLTAAQDPNIIWPAPHTTPHCSQPPQPPQPPPAAPSAAAATVAADHSQSTRDYGISGTNDGDKVVATAAASGSRIGAGDSTVQLLQNGLEDKLLRLNAVPAAFTSPQHAAAKADDDAATAAHNSMSELPTCTLAQPQRMTRGGRGWWTSPTKSGSTICNANTLAPSDAAAMVLQLPSTSRWMVPDDDDDVITSKQIVEVVMMDGRWSRFPNLRPLQTLEHSGSFTPQPPFRPMFDVIKPNPSFTRRKPDAPSFRVCALASDDAPPPSIDTLRACDAAYGGDGATLVFAVVENGDITFSRMEHSDLHALI